MNRILFRRLLILSLLLFGSWRYAEKLYAADDAGAQLASRGGPNGATACASCHGARGEGNPASGFPRLAGQPHDYLARQLSSFANGKRNNPVMAPIAKALTPQQIQDVSRYYEQLAAPAAPQQNAAKPADRGRALAERGDERLAVQACGNCHGPGGIGEPPTYPYLAAQSASYLGAALQEWKSGARDTDPSGQMPAIAKRLSTDDIKAVAGYYAAQSPVPAAVVRGSVAALARPGAPASQAPSQPVQGVGTEQGAPLTGGSQGAGGGGGASGGGPMGTPDGGNPR